MTLGRCPSPARSIAHDALAPDADRHCVDCRNARGRGRSLRGNSTTNSRTVDEGTICIYSDTEADILIDVTAAFGPNGLGIVPVTPIRILDTRRTVPFARDEIRGYNSLGSQVSPLTPQSASVNVTALDHPTDGFVTTFDCVTMRDTSTLNPGLGTVSANGAIVP